MGYKKLNFIAVFAVFFIISCGSRPETAHEPPPSHILQPPREAQETAEIQVEIKEEVYGPVSVSEEYYYAIRTEVQQFIQNLNQIIRSRNYNAWRAALSPEHFAEISSAENLRFMSEQPAMRMRNIVLRNANDYFTHVVVPSRAGLNDEVDNIDIEFVTLNKVMAFIVTTTARGETHQLRLYDLEKIDNSWLIIN